MNEPDDGDGYFGDFDAVLTGRVADPEWAHASTLGDAPEPEPKPDGSDYRIALRDNDRDELDDVVVNDVSMFRAERMDDRSLWMCCYLAGEDDWDNRVSFWVRASRRGRLRLDFTCTEQPAGVVYEDDDLRARQMSAMHARSTADRADAEEPADD